MVLIVIGILILVAGLYAINIYNFFNTAQTRIDASIQEIANQLKRQADLIPNLAESTKGYMQHEQQIFDKLAAARETVLQAAKDPALIEQAANATQSILPQITALAESNPELKADSVVNRLMNELRDTADKIMYSRRLLIDLTQDYNAKLKTFPSNQIGKMFNFKPLPGLKTPEPASFTTVSETDIKDVKINL